MCNIVNNGLYKMIQYVAEWHFSEYLNLLFKLIHLNHWGERRIIRKCKTTELYLFEYNIMKYCPAWLAVYQEFINWKKTEAIKTQRISRLQAQISDALQRTSLHQSPELMSGSYLCLFRSYLILTHVQQRKTTNSPYLKNILTFF